jgi:heterotetrameric sarcosine oxidase delta subunit
MLRIHCPWCGERDHTEFSYGGDATVVRPGGDAPDEVWLNYVYIRDNPRGAHQEYWHHVQGCRQWLRVTRNTLTHEIAEVAAVAPSSGSL